MRKEIKIAIVVCLLLVGITAVLLLSKKYEKERNYDLTFSPSLLVTNGTQYSLVDTMVLIAVDSIFQYDSIVVNIFYMHRPMIVGDINIMAFVLKNSFVDHNYSIFLSREIDEREMPLMLAHELVHLKQMEDGDLIQLGLTSVYKGDTIDLLNVPYEQRPYEIDAFKEDDRLLDKINEILYKQ